MATGVQRGGLAYNITQHWGVTASVTYIPLKTTSSVIIKAVDGTRLGESKAELKAHPIITYLAVTYKF